MPGIFNPDGYGIAKLIWSLLGDPEPMICTFGYSRPEAGTPDDDATAIALSYAAAFVAADLGTEWTFRGVEVQWGEESGSGGAVGVFVTAEAGTGAAPRIVQNTAGLVHKRTAVGGRRGRGRFYWPAGYFAESVVSGNGSITAGIVTDMNVQFSAFLDELGTNEVPMVLLHVQELDLIPPYDVTTLALDATVATQRRRLRR